MRDKWLAMEIDGEGQTKSRDMQKAFNLYSEISNLLDRNLNNNK